MVSLIAPRQSGRNEQEYASTEESVILIMCSRERSDRLALMIRFGSHLARRYSAARRSAQTVTQVPRPINVLRTAGR